MSRLARSAIAAAFGVLLAPGWIDSAFAERRVALVVGNSAYQNVAPLPNPINDAKAMTAKFTQAGFNVVSAQYDLGNLQMKRALREFEDAAANADIAVVFFAGHGIEVRGINYMIPVDARLASDRDAEDEAITLDRLLQSVEGAKRFGLVILDACRDNPFLGKMKRARATAMRAVSGGLSIVEPMSRNMLIAYAAKAGAFAEDGIGEHSPFTAALLNHLFVPGLDVRLAFGRVRDEVLKDTRQRQEPFVSGSLGGAHLSIVAPPAQPVLATVDPSGQRNDYALVEKIGTHRAWEIFLTQHPSGFYAELARQQIAKLGPAEQGSSATTTRAAEGTTVAALDLNQRPPPPRPSSEEQRAWDRIKDSSNAAALRDFIKRYPSSVLVNTAQTRLDALERAARERDEKARAEHEAKAAEAERQKVEREAALQRSEDERLAKLAETARAKQEAAAEAERQKAEREAALRRADEERRAKAAEAERAKQEAAAEVARQRAEREASLKRAEEERRAKAAEAAERQKLEREATLRRAEEERLAKLSEAARAKQEATADAERQRAERETARKRAEEERLAKAAEAERARQAADVAAARQKAERDAALKRAEEERLAKLAETARATQEAAAAAQRQQTEREAALRRAQEEQLARAAEAESAKQTAEAEAERQRAQRDAANKRGEEDRLAKLAESARIRREAACRREENLISSLQATSTRINARKDLERLEYDLTCERLRPSLLAALDKLITEPASEAKVEPSKPASSTPELVRTAQKELARIGCFAGPVDGNLNAATKAAVKRYQTQRGQQAAAEIEITDRLVSELEKRSSRICPLVCPTGKVAEGEQCVAARKPAPVAKQKKDEDEKPARSQKAKQEEAKPQPRVRQEAAAPARQSGGGGGGGGSKGGAMIGVGF